MEAVSIHCTVFARIINRGLVYEFYEVASDKGVGIQESMWGWQCGRINPPRFMADCLRQLN